MGIRRDVEYVDPKYGLEGNTRTAFVDMSSRGESDGTMTPCVVAQASGPVVAKSPVAEAVDEVLNGRRTSFRSGQVGAFLTAAASAGGSTLTVDSTTGFAAGDPIAIFNASADGVPTSPEYHLIDTVTDGTHLDLGSATLAGDFYKGARVVRLRGFDVSAGTAGRGGIKHQLTAPSPVSISVVENSGDIRVTISLNDEDEATHFDTYIRETRFRRIEPGWQPDDANRTAADAAGAYDVSTFEGGANCVPDGGGGALVSGHTYYVAVVAKNASGIRDVDESQISNVEEITLA